MLLPAPEVEEENNLPSKYPTVPKDRPPSPHLTPRKMKKTVCSLGSQSERKKKDRKKRNRSELWKGVLIECWLLGDVRRLEGWWIDLDVGLVKGWMACYDECRLIDEHLAFNRHPFLVSTDRALTTPSSTASRPFSRRTPPGINRRQPLLHPLHNRPPTVEVVMMVVMM